MCLTRSTANATALGLGEHPERDPRIHAESGESDMSAPPDEFKKMVAEISHDLNNLVFPALDEAVHENPRLRRTLNPAFPFPQKVRIGALENYLAVEYVGPEKPDDPQFDTQGVYGPSHSVLDFLGVDLSHLQCPRLPVPDNVENMQMFVGEAVGLLGDYLYDVVANPSDFLLNGVFDFDLTPSSKALFVSNVTILWVDSSGALRVRRVDFMELHPRMEGGWGHQTPESLSHFAKFLTNYQVPEYEPGLHAVLNGFIQLVAAPENGETVLTDYLTKHPEILQLAFGAHKLNPQTDLIWQFQTDKPNLKPDFMPVRMDGYADILEFKLPRLKSKAMVGTATRSHPSSEVEHALSQIDEYEEWCNQEVNSRWLESTKGIKVNQPHTTLVIGHSDEFSAEDRRRLRGRRNATIFTYDEFIEMARMQLYRVR